MQRRRTKRVLLVTFNRLFPADRGNARRIHQMVDLYKRQGFEVDLLYHNEEGLDAALSQALLAEFMHVQVLPSRASKRIDDLHLCRVSDWYDTALELVALEMHRLRAYQVVQVNYVWYAPLLQRFDAAVLKVLDSHDIFADRAEKHLLAGMPPAWFNTTVEEEDRCFRMADVVLAIQRGEAREMAHRGHRHVLYMPWMESPHAEFTPRESGPESHGQASGILTLGYLGSANMWNMRSLDEFATELDRQCGGSQPPFQLVIAGGLSKHAPRQPGVVAYGYVHELRSFYRSIDLALNPMVGGTGLKIKTVEPLAHGCPVLCTEAGADGLAHVWQLPVFDTPKTLIEFLLQELAVDPLAWLPRLRGQAKASRETFVAECEHQAARYAHWLTCRLAGAGAMV